MTKAATPRHLARRVHAYLIRRHRRAPSQSLLAALFDTLYYASLCTEEGRAVQVHVVFMDSTNPDPEPPENPPQDRWSVTRLGSRIPFDVPTLTKIAAAADPRSSALAVDTGPHGSLQIWGLVDQQNLYLDFLNYDSDSGPERPGLFQATILGPGHIAAYLEYEKLAELRINELVGKPVDVLSGAGPIRKILDPHILRLAREVESAIPEDVREMAGDVTSGIRWRWIATLIRILIRIQRFRHGGALLLTPDRDFRHLNIKYPLQYPRLRTAMLQRELFDLQSNIAQSILLGSYIEKDDDMVPADLYLDEVVCGRQASDASQEVEGAVWFVSLLSRVDGLVLLSPDLSVHGFGVEITAATPPAEVFLFADSRASARRMRLGEYGRYGTRHRSMMRYCAAVPGSVGFVVSQDGDVRAITSQGPCVALWENIKLQLELPSRWQPLVEEESVST